MSMLALGTGLLEFRDALNYLNLKIGQTSVPVIESSEH
jgi:hypothetical protein